MDHSTPTPRLTIQSEGTRISRAYGHTGKAACWRIMSGRGSRPLSCRSITNASRAGFRSIRVADVDDIYGRVVAYERLLLPFLTDDKVSHVIASLKTFSEDGGFEIKI